MTEVFQTADARGLTNGHGIRVRNLLAETQLPAGDNEFVWDGYDDGVRNADGDILRTRVPPGTYTVRGLTMMERRHCKE
jgi:hypothetical protein